MSCKLVGIVDAVLVVSACATAIAQQADKVPAFEAASIVANKSGSLRGGVRIDPERLTATNATMNQLVFYAYDVRAYQVSGPARLNTERYDVAAKAESQASTDQMRFMLRTLLRDRFGFRAHWETKETPVYWLVVARGGPKLQAEKEADALTRNGRPPPLKAGVNGMFMRGALSDLAEVLTRPAGRPVLDKTGIEGRYLFQLEWALDPVPSGSGPVTDGRGALPDSAPSLFTAVEEKFGLKLESHRTPIEILVIEAVEKVPTEN